LEVVTDLAAGSTPGDFGLHDLDAVIGGELVVLDGQGAEIGEQAADDRDC
jgi:hypothetical protein